MKVLKAGIVVIFIVIFSIHTSATDLSTGIANDIKEQYCTDIPSDISPQALFDGFCSALEQSAVPVSGSFAKICCVIILAAVFKAIRDSLSEGGGEMYDLCSSLICALVLYTTVKTAYNAVDTAFIGIQSLMTAMLGAMSAIYGLSGNFIAGGASISTLMLVLQVMQFVVTSVLFPLISVCFGFCILSPFPFCASAGELVGFIKRTVVFTCTAISAALGIVLTYQSILVKTADSAVLRGIKFSASAFVPVVGASLSESVNTIAAALSTVKASAGLGGIISICGFILPPVLILAADKLMLMGAKLLCTTLGLSEIRKLTDGFDGILSIMLALTVCSGVVLILACALFSVS